MPKKSVVIEKRNKLNEEQEFDLETDEQEKLQKFAEDEVGIQDEKKIKKAQEEEKEKEKVLANNIKVNE